MNAEEYLKLVDEAYKTMNVEQLRSRFIELTNKAREENGPESPEYIVMLNELGTLERGQYSFDAAEKYYLEALKASEKNGGETNGDYATTLNNLAGTYRMAGRYSKAEECFFHTLEIYRKTIGEEHMLYASALNNLGLVYLAQGDTETAIEYLSKASGIIGRLQNVREEYATSLANLGSLYIQNGNYASAIENLSEAVSIYENELDMRSNHYHVLLHNLGLAYYAYGRTSDARKTWEKAAECVKKLYGTDHAEYISIMKKLEMTKNK